jgi:FkbM family methyltransferase
MPLVDPTAHIQKYWSLGVFYERALMADLWQRFGQSDLRRIYDVGASVGNHTAWFALAWPQATVYAFEPHTPSMEILSVVVRKNGLDRRTMLCPYALGADAARGQTTTHGNEGMNRVSGGDDFAIYRMDALAFSPPDLVKIDVEGMEMAVLEGMDRTLRVHRPALYIEGDVDALTNHLAPYGYRHVWTGCATPTHAFTTTS